MASENSEYLTLREEKRIARDNARAMKAFEKQKKKRVEKSEYETTMRDRKNILEIDELHTYFYTELGVSKAVNGVSFDIPENSVVGVVGESGCGKSVTSLSIMRLVQAPSGQIVEGSIRYRAVNGECFDLCKMPQKEIQNLRGKEISMIFQEPMTSLNPVFTIGEQLDEVVLLHEERSRETAKKRSLEMLRLVGIASPEKVYTNYPHELSGGMRQRVVIAMALLCNPRLIIADEPTTALDVTIQAQIIDLLRDIKKRIKGSILLITHDLGVVAEMADYVVVMYAGRVIEKGTAEEIFHEPKHPYTVGLMKSKPSLGQRTERLYSIPGQVPNPIAMPDYCYYQNRCELCLPECLGDYPQTITFSKTHMAVCKLYKEEKDVGIFDALEALGGEKHDGE